MLSRCGAVFAAGLKLCRVSGRKARTHELPVCSIRAFTHCRWSTAARCATATRVGDDKLLIVTTDRLSAFDVVMRQPIPDKGRVLNAMSNFWFDAARRTSSRTT